MTVGYPNPDEWATGRLSAPPRLTVLTSKSGPLTKSYEATENGRVRRVSAPLSVSNGVAQVAELQAATAGAALEKLRQGVSKFTGSMALMTGCPVGAGKEWEIVPKSEEDIAQRKVSRSKDCFRGVEGPALLALDFDLKEYPEHVREKVKRAGGLEAVMASVFPSIGTAARLILPSASSYIRNIASGQCTGQAGEHWYFVVSDGRKTSALADLIADHLEAKGWCWGHVTKNGNVIVKTLIDRAATAPERIMYEAAPVLGPGLENNPEKAPRLIEGGVLDAESIAPIDAALRALQEQHRQAEKARVAQEAAKRRKEWKAERVSDLIERGVEPEKARRTADAAAGCELTGDFLITFDDGSSATAREILANPEAYDKRKGPDPIEPEYGGGKNIAVLQTGYPAQIYSQAHGGTIYRLVDDPADYFDPMEFEAAPPPKTDDAAQDATAAKPEALPDLCVVSGVVEAATLPVRQWVIYPRFPLGDVAQIVGEPGVSKSTFAIRDALALATGRRDIIEGRDAHGNPVSPERIHRPGPVIIYNAEDRLDEMKRRLVAAQRHFGIRPEDMKHPVILWSGVDMQHLTILEVTDKGPRIAEGAATLRRYLSRHRPVLVYLDTQLSLKRGGNENATDDQDALMQELARIAAEAGTAICTIHHTSKSTTLNRGDMGAGRGAFSAVGKVRAAFTLCRVTGAAPDERRMGMTADEELIVLDYAKLSAGKKPESGIFLRRVDTPVGNGAGEPSAAEAAAYFSEDPAEALRLRGDNAPVLDLVDVRSRGAVPDEVRNAEDEAEKRRIALIVADLLDGERECQLSMIWEAAGDRMRRERLTGAKARPGVTAALTGALAAPGVEVEHKGQNVLIKAFRKGEGATAAWFVARFEGGA